jgi:hypothetical protein
MAARIPDDVADPAAITAQLLTEASAGQAARASALAEVLARLWQVSLRGLAGQGVMPAPLTLSLVVYDERDWQAQLSYPYGFPFYRHLPTAGDKSQRGQRQHGQIFAPAHYPARLLWVWEQALARHNQAQPGPVAGFFDLALGHELGHAIAASLGLRLRVRWLDEFLATYLFVVALAEADPAGHAQVLAWGEALACAPDCALAAPALMTERHDLGAFEFPFVRLPLANQAWYQARFTLFAEQLRAERGWEWLATLAGSLASGSHSGSPLDRGAIHRQVVLSEPRFREWFRSFGEAA